MPTPNDPTQVPMTGPGVDPAAEEVQRQAATDGGAGLGDMVVGVAEVAGDLVDVADVAGSAAEVGGEVLGGALEGLGSGLELAGGCAEGCSVMVALVVLLATAGTALALGWF